MSVSLFNEIVERLAPFFQQISDTNIGWLFRNKQFSSNSGHKKPEKGEKITELMNFFLTMTLFSNGIFSEKLKVLFRILQIFENNDKSKKRRSISLYSAHFLIRFLYERSFNLIPPPFIENMVDFKTHGMVNRILQARLTQNQIPDLEFTEFLQDISLFLHFSNISPDLMFNNKELIFPIDDFMRFNKR